MGFDAQKNKELFYLLFAEPTNTIADFSTDGCSSFPNGRHFGTKKEWIHCCYIHDVDYWYGGPEDLKKKADEELNKCVSKAQSESLGFIMDVGVTIGGKPGLTSWRWAYGWNYLIKYESLNEEQEKSLSSKIITVAETFLKLKDGLTYPQRMAIYQRLYLLGLENSHNLKQEELDQYNERISKLTLFEL
tara:strand:- start:83168 stop:83734 length:567 start_codon:yes stop_codon:yes gene_type:complete